MSDDVVQCWWCGAEPDEVIEIREFGGVISHIFHWPASDHDCAVTPPSADALLDQVLLRSGRVAR